MNYPYFEAPLLLVRAMTDVTEGGGSLEWDFANHKNKALYL